MDQEDLENKRRRRDHQKGCPDCVFCENPIIEKLGDKEVTLPCNHKHKAHSDCINYFKRHRGKKCPECSKDINTIFTKD